MFDIRVQIHGQLVLLFGYFELNGFSPKREFSLKKIHLDAKLNIFLWLKKKVMKIGIEKKNTST